MREAKAEYEIPKTPEEVAKLKVDQLKELLELHGVEDPQGLKPELAEQLTTIMFADL